MDQVLATTWAGPRFLMTLLSVFGGLSLLLAAVGLYGVMSYIISERTHEIGIRMALGSRRRDVLTLVLRQGLGLATAGMLLGVAGALALNRLLQGMLFGVSPSDPATFVTICVALLGVALLASYLPARRASHINPLLAMQYE
jgi:putative ABC transport system permease protein